MTEPTVHLTLVGGPTLLVELAGLRLLTDPTFDPPGAYASGSVTLTKTSGPALSAEAIGPVDAVLLSHDQHPDNLDRGGRASLAGAQRVLTTPAGARRLPGADGLGPWERRTLVGRDGSAWTVTATPARHGPPGIEPIAGDVTGFVVTDAGGADLLYVTGDTVWFEGAAEVSRRFRPRLVVPFAGSARTRGAFHLTMDANDALETAHAFPDATLVPVHDQGWAHFTESAEDLAHAFEVLGQRSRLLVLEPGQRTAVSLARGRGPGPQLRG
ncbi:MBL fold metallo-hydrolase [Anaeromyxobacter oryzae]|uniref:MBL fold metallo-hydrolase n=1 Tax=Anaeromyxobacter oryzae TaxID=2918170 RepID=A0ABM7WPQ3_9BACT|nr:MBL fold metallo-hydrolase [Anaeromyxobacter oryzae]BDG01440.1 MBL fold metallo-hydrolase [Anaeromyxobacter oryzae]